MKKLTEDRQQFTALIIMVLIIGAAIIHAPSQFEMPSIDFGSSSSSSYYYEEWGYESEPDYWADWGRP